MKDGAFLFVSEYIILLRKPQLGNQKLAFVVKTASQVRELTTDLSWWLWLSNVVVPEPCAKPRVKLEFCAAQKILDPTIKNISFPTSETLRNP
jgi:hypothetical protein